MLVELKLKNYRGFRDHTVPFRDKTIMVGKNNAGKSTIVEALRILSIIARRYQSLNYRAPPGGLGIPRRLAGVSPSLKGTDIDLTYVCHRYDDPPACLEAKFLNNEEIHVYLTPENLVYAVIYDQDKNLITSRQQSRGVKLGGISALPQVGPVQVEERLLNEDYVRGAELSTLSPRHFRNQLSLFEEDFTEFKEMAENTWPGLRIRNFESVDSENSKLFSLLVQDGVFVSEVGNVGHGLQIWLQTVWFLTRFSKAETIILDEPDVYLHADLQKRLVRHIINWPNQLIMATHSIEIMSEVSPDEILIIDKSEKKSAFASTVPVVQMIIDHMGSIHNIQLARLWSERKLILVEGKDLGILKALQNRIYPESKQPLDSIPNMSIGGWGGWNYAVGSSMLLKNALNQNVITYCVLDSDYHTGAEVKKRTSDAEKRGVSLHIWDLKEIENYLLSEDAIARIINRDTNKNLTVSGNDVLRQMKKISSSLKSSIVANIAEPLVRESAKHDIKIHI